MQREGKKSIYNMGPEMLNYRVIRLFIKGSAGLKLVNYPSYQNFAKDKTCQEHNSKQFSFCIIFTKSHY